MSRWKHWPGLQAALKHWPGLVAALLATLASFNMVIDDAYSEGPTLFDSAIFSTAIWRSGLSLTEAPALGSRTFYLRHISPIQLIPNLFSYVVPCDRNTFFALCYGLTYGGLVLASYLVIEPLFSGRFSRHAAALAGLAVFCSQVVFDASWEVHLEIVAPVCAVFAFRAWQLRRYRMALLWFLLTAGVREDCAFQMAVPLCLIALHQWYTARGTDPERAKERLRLGAGFCTIFVLYSAAALWAFRYYVPRVEGVDYDYYHMLYFDRTDPFKHVNGALLGSRVWSMLTQGAGRTLPLVALFVAAELFRDFPIFVGAVGFLPYLLSLFLAKDEGSAIWLSYKGYPLIILLVWPALMALGQPAALRKRYLFIQMVVLLLSLSYVRERHVEVALSRWWLQPTARNAELYRRFGEKQFEEEKPNSPRTLVTAAIAALYPYQVNYPDQLIPEKISAETVKNCDTLIWFEGELFQSRTDDLLARGDFSFTAVPGTKIRIGHRRVHSESGRIAPIPVPYQPGPASLPALSEDRRYERLAAQSQLFAAAVSLGDGRPFPSLSLGNAWRTLLVDNPWPFGQPAVPAPPVGGASVVVWNSEPWPRTEVVRATIGAGPALRARPAGGGPAGPVQNLSSGPERNDVAFLATVPAAGYSVFTLEPGGDVDPSSPAPATLREMADTFVLANGRLTAVVDRATGELVSVVDAASSRETLATGARGNVLEAAGVPGRAQPPSTPADWEKAQVMAIASGPLRATIRVARRYRQSTVVQQLSLDAASSRLDFEDAVTWREEGAAPARAFTLAAHDTGLTCGVPFGTLLAGASASAAGTVQHGWADLSDREHDPLPEEGAAVDLAPFFDACGSAPDDRPALGDFDGGGTSYPRAQIPAHVALSGVELKVAPGPPGSKDFVECRGQSIGVAPGEYDDVLIAGASIGGDGQGTFAVLMPSGDGLAFELTLPDWCHPTGGDLTALVECDHRTRDGGSDGWQPKIWGVTLHLGRRTGVAAIRLPDRSSMRIFAITLLKRGVRPRSFGATILSASSQRFEVEGGCVRLVGSPHAPGTAVETLTSRYSLLPHEGDWREAASVRRGEEAASPLVARSAPPSEGRASSWSFLSVEPPSVEVECVPGEGPERWTLRLRERHGLPARARVTLPRPFDIVTDLSGPGPPASEPLAERTVLGVDLGPWETRTLVLRRSGD